MTRVFIYLFFFGGILQSEKMEQISIQPNETDNFISASFRLWIPDEVEEPKAILVLLPGFNGNGLNLVEKIIWKNLAVDKKLALISCSLQCENGIVNYDEAQAGSGRALEEAVSTMGKRVGLDLNKTKFIFFGHSAGGQFGFHFACWKPDRVLAFVTAKGGCYNESLITDKAQMVPGLWIIGELDKKWRKDAVFKIIKTNKNIESQWNYSIDSNFGHEVGKSELICFKFFMTNLEKY